METLNLVRCRKLEIRMRNITGAMCRKVLSLLEDEKSPLTVTEIYIKLRRGQSEVSQALKKLRDANVVQGERDGKEIYYTVIGKEVSLLNDHIYYIT